MIDGIVVELCWDGVIVSHRTDYKVSHEVLYTLKTHTTQDILEISLDAMLNGLKWSPYFTCADFVALMLGIGGKYTLPDLLLRRLTNS